MKLTESNLSCYREILEAKEHKSYSRRRWIDKENEISMSLLLCPREPLDDLGDKMSRYLGFAIADGLDRFGEKRFVVFRFYIS